MPSIETNTDKHLMDKKVGTRCALLLPRGPTFLSLNLRAHLPEASEEVITASQR